jgi:hypothetical protein
MAPHLRANGKMASLVGMENTLGPVEAVTKAFGSTTSAVDGARTPGYRKTLTKENGKMTRNMEKEPMCGLMGGDTKEVGSMTRDAVVAPFCGQNLDANTREIGRTITAMVLENSHGRIQTFTKESGSTESALEKGS